MREHPLPQLTIQQLDYLVAATDHETWAEAAASLGVTPSALSQGLAELERRLGIGLFERVGRRRVIADSSRPVVDFARRVLTQTEDLTRWIDRRERGTTGSLRLGMIDAAAIGHFPEVLRSFRSNRPEIEFTLTVAPSGQLLASVAAGALDLAVAVAPPSVSSELEWTEIRREDLGVYAPPGAPIGPPPSWGPWVSFDEQSHTRALIDRALRTEGSPFTVVAESNQPDVLKEMVRLGIGWTVLPIVQAETQPSALRRARERPLLQRTLIGVTRRGSIDQPLVREFMALLNEP